MVTQKDFAARREALLQQLGRGVVLIPAAPLTLRNRDVEHAYRQDSDFHYLSGFAEPESVLLLTTEHAEHRFVMFVRPKDKERETWEGRRAGVEGALADFGADAAFPIDELEERLPDYLGNVERVVYRAGEHCIMDNVFFSCLRALRKNARRGKSAPLHIIDTAEALHEMRLHKSAAEIELMRRAASISAEAHSLAMREAAPGRYEYEIEASLLHTFHKHGCERAAYDCIVGSGPNATILHYRENNRQMADGDLLLIDAGCEYGYYASDVTRTFPVNGKFSEAQRALYEVVLSAQKQAIAAVKPGTTLDAIHDLATRVLVEGLIDLGLLQGKADALIEAKEHHIYYMHRTSHWLGMDVHDVGAYRVKGEHRHLEPGFALTVEPGLYIAEDAEVDAKWRGIGIRIEDDVVVTQHGYEVLSASVPKEVAEVEAACA